MKVRIAPPACIHLKAPGLIAALHLTEGPLLVVRLCGMTKDAHTMTAAVLMPLHGNLTQVS